MPCVSPHARTSALPKYGCSSIWFTAGTTSASAASLSRCSIWKLETPIERARPSGLNSSSVLPGRDIAVVALPRQRPVDEEEIDVAQAGRRERPLECTTRVVGRVRAVPELARDEEIAPLETRRANCLAHACLVAVHLRRVEVPVADLERLGDHPGRVRGRDLEDPQAQLRDRVAVVQLDFRDVTERA